MYVYPTWCFERNSCSTASYNTVLTKNWAYTVEEKTWITKKELINAFQKWAIDYLIQYGINNLLLIIVPISKRGLKIRINSSLTWRNKSVWVFPEYKMSSAFAPTCWRASAKVLLQISNKIELEIQKSNFSLNVQWKKFVWYINEYYTRKKRTNWPLYDGENEETIVFQFFNGFLIWLTNVCLHKVNHNSRYACSHWQ